MDGMTSISAITSYSSTPSFFGYVGLERSALL
jgi:hypothetical protein